MAITRNRLIGIDLETPRAGIDFASIARDHFTELEQRRFFAAGDGERAAIFFRIWKQKEAISKALGLGLRLGFASIGVEPDLNRECRWVEGLREESRRPWTLKEVSIAQGETAVVAVQDEAPTFHVSQWTAA